MDSMVERVARAFHDALYADVDSGAWMSGKCPLESVTIDGDVDLLKAARAAINALMEPTPPMREAMDELAGTINPADCWYAAIEAALSDTEGR